MHTNLQFSLLQHFRQAIKAHIAHTCKSHYCLLHLLVWFITDHWCWLVRKLFWVLDWDSRKCNCSRSTCWTRNFCKPRYQNLFMLKFIIHFQYLFRLWVSVLQNAHRSRYFNWTRSEHARLKRVKSGCTYEVSLTENLE